MQEIVFNQVTVQVHALEALYPGGNKYFKLKLNLAAAKNAGHTRLISFGGAWSNHIHALAKVGAAQGFETIGIIRGEAPAVPSVMLEDAKAYGMNLHYVSRQQYREKTTPAFKQWLTDTFGAHYLLPEGGSNDLAVLGCEQIVTELEAQGVDYDLLCLPVGTGGTLAGVASVLPATKQVLGFSVLKGAVSLDGDVTRMMQVRNKNVRNCSINHDYHCGGYARCPAYLKTFILDFEALYGFQLDPVYTGKLFYGLFDLIKSGQITKKTRVLALHTGGSQGRRGFNF